MAVQLFEKQSLSLNLTTIVTDDGEIFLRLSKWQKLWGMQSHVSDKYKARFSDFERAPNQGPFANYHPDTVFISEPGFYSMVFNSKLSAAETFQDWVFSEVLPSIRQTGSYTLTDPIEKIRSISCSELMTYNTDQIKEYRTMFRTHVDMLKDPVKEVAMVGQQLKKTDGTSLRNLLTWKGIKFLKRPLETYV